MQLARCLANLGKKVVVADFDFDAPGIPSVFNTRLEEGSEGFCELITEFIDVRPHNELEYRRFQSRVKDCLVNVDGDFKTGGLLKFLPSGHLSNQYFAQISGAKWLQWMSSDELLGSCVSFIGHALKPVLEEMNIDYLFIDSAAGIDFYGTLARSVATRLVALS
jgi:MinD-like ATPase involved in chromosome partitioning or flagellar assembly